MQSVYSLPPSGEVEMGDDIPRDEIPRSVAPLTSSSSSSMSVTQNAAVADNSGEVERQRQLAQYEIQQREIIPNRQIELVRQNAAPMLQEQTQAHREEATYAVSYAFGYVKHLTETALKTLNKQIKNNDRWLLMMTGLSRQLTHKEIN